MPMMKIAEEINTKKAREARLCGRPVVRGNIPISPSDAEPRIRITTPNLPNLFRKCLLPNPKAKIRLKVPARISPRLKSVAAEPSAPRTLRWFSVQLNRCEIETAADRKARPITCEAMPQAPAIRLNIASCTRFNPFVFYRL